MKRHLLTAALPTLLFLAACQPETAAGTDSAAGPAAAGAVTAESCPPAVAGYRFLPEGVDVPFPHHLRTDNIYAKDGDQQQRRRIRLEFLEGNADGTLSAVEKSMLDAGYSAGRHKVRDDGSTVVRYKGAGMPDIVVTVDPEAGDKPNHPQARGVVTYDYALDAGTPPGAAQ